MSVQDKPEYLVIDRVVYTCVGDEILWQDRLKANETLPEWLERTLKVSDGAL